MLSGQWTLLKELRLKNSCKNLNSVFVATVQSLLRSSIPIPPSNFKLRDDHVSGSTRLKGMPMFLIIFLILHFQFDDFAIQIDSMLVGNSQIHSMFGWDSKIEFIIVWGSKIVSMIVGDTTTIDLVTVGDSKIRLILFWDSKTASAHSRFQNWFSACLRFQN